MGSQTKGNNTNMKSQYQSAKSQGRFGFSRRAVKQATLTLLATLAIATGASAQTALTSGQLVGFDVQGNNGTSPTPTVDPSVTSTILSRTTVLSSSAANSFSSNNWNTTNTLNTTTNYISFSVTAGSSAVTFGSLQFAINGSNTAPNQGQWAYTLNGGTSFTLGTTADGGAFTTKFAAPTSLSGWDFTDFTLAAGATVQFRFYDYGATSINGIASAASGTVRIANITGNDLIVNDSTVVIPEPTTVWTALGLVGVAGLVIYRRNQQTT